MNIVFAMHDIMDLGGIITYVEDLGQGFMESGHSVELVRLSYKPKRQMPRSDFVTGKLGVPMHIVKGWIYQKGFSYQDRAGLRKWRQYVNDWADLVLWVVPVPTKNNGTHGNDRWPLLYKGLDCPQLAAIHDGHAPRLYPWLYNISENLTALVCLHPMSYNSTVGFPIMRAMLTHPIDLTPLWQGDIRNRRAGYISLQNFKAWKHVDNVIRAVPYMTHIHNVIAGYGIEQRYMVSKDKVKPKYVCDKKLDPDLPTGDIGKTIWNRALENGMDWLGVINEPKRDRYMRRMACLVDTSYSKTYSKYGGVYNRTFFEAMVRGCVPLMYNLGISDNEEGYNGIFKPGVHYGMIPYGSTPLEFAECVVDYCTDHTWLEKVQEENVVKIQRFDARVMAGEYLDLAFKGKIKDPVYKQGVGEADWSMIDRGQKIYRSHFTGGLS